LRVVATTTADMVAEGKALYEDIVRCTNNAVVTKFLLGEVLLRLRNQPECGGYGRWQKFVRANFPFTPQAASGYMRLAAAPEEKRKRIFDFKLTLAEALAELREPQEKPQAAVPAPDAPLWECANMKAPWGCSLGQEFSRRYGAKQLTLVRKKSTLEWVEGWLPSRPAAECDPALVRIVNKLSAERRDQLLAQISAGGVNRGKVDD
jgi:hypothetical protein